MKLTEPHTLQTASMNRVVRHAAETEFAASQTDLSPARSRDRRRVLVPVLRAGLRSKFLFAVFSAAGLGSVAHAQFTSNVQGTVTDASGAVVPRATVMVESLSTGARRSVASGSAGEYRFNSLAPGRYKIYAQAPGFGTQTVETALTTEQTTGVNLQLPSATVNEQVNVNSAVGPLLNPDETRLQVTLDRSQIDELPLQNRNIYSIVTVAPGVTGFVDSGSSDDFMNENRVQASANGHFSGSNEYLLDGFSISSAITGGTANVAPNPDSVQEAALQTNTFSTDQGQGSSVLVELTTRSGTNAFHGAINYQYSDNNLKRFGYFQKVYNPFRRHDISVAAGGPIIKDRLFFFGSTEIKRRLVPAGTGSVTAETPAFVAYGKSINPNGLGVSLLERFPAALVSTSTVQTSGQVLGCTNGVTNTGNLACNIPFIIAGQNPRATPDNGRQYNFRFDYTTRSGRDKAYVNYYNTSNDAAVILNRPGFDVHTTLTNFFLSGNYTHVFGNSLLNQASFATYGVKGNQAQGGDYTILTTIITQISSPFGIVNGPGIFQQATYSGRDVLSYVRGKQSFRLGGEVRHETDKANFALRLSRPVYTFQTVLDVLNDNPLTEANVTYDPVTGQQKLDRFGGQDTIFSIFIDDDYKVTSKLLLTFGIRYDDFGNVTPYGFDTYKQSANILLSPGSDYLTRIAGAHSVLNHGGVYNGQRSNNWSPRGSFAYSPRPTLSIRGGIGMYLDEIGLGQTVDRVNTDPPSFFIPTFDRRAGIAPVFSVASNTNVNLNTTTPNPFGFSIPPFKAGLDAKGGIPGANAAVTAIDPNLKLPRTLIYVAGVEQALGKTAVLGVNYSGSYLSDQIIGPNLNRAPGSLNIVTNIKTLPNTSFGSISDIYNGGYGHYDALIATFRQSMSTWLNYEASYTWSHSRDIGVGGAIRTNLTIGQDDYPDPTNIGRYYADSSFDTRNRVTVAGFVRSPFHHSGWSRQLLDGYELSSIAVGQTGQPFSVFNSSAYKVVNGVNVGGDYQAQGYNYAFPNAPITNYVHSHSKSEYVAGLFKAAEFTAPPVGVLVQGTETRNHYRNPGLFNLDASLIKQFGYTKGDHAFLLKLRLDAYNAINRTNLTGVTSDLASASFGKSTNNYQPRTLQLGARIEF